MQKLTSTICKNVAVGTEGSLVDIRDSKNYYVAKLKDGNCWMTQNLDYNDPNSSITKFTESFGVSGWTSTSASYQAYYDPGDYYYTNVNDWSNCGSQPNGLPVCTGNGWDTSGNQHYHVGNYYTYQTALSICPSGWQLPTSNSTTDNGSFGKLTTAYGISSNAAGATALRNSPMYFIPGGLVGSGSLNNAGERGYYWSSTAHNSTLAYDLYFNSSAVNPSHRWDRYYGFPVRCLVQGS